jgi:endonuclease/exonuclease/phosphatase family metal-dependent hydrolase
MRSTAFPLALPRRRTAAALGILLALLLSLLVAAPADAATARPAQVGVVSYVGASLTGTDRASLTIRWAPVRTAATYEVFVGSSFTGVAGVTTPSVTVREPQAVIPNLARGKDYFVQVRAVNAAGKAGYKSYRVGHRTIVAEGSGAGTTYKLMTWNVCSNKCAGIATRQKLVNARIVETQPSMVALQEAIKYSAAPTGYRFAFKGNNAILYDTDVFTLVATGEQVLFSSKYTSGGNGVSWAALKDRTTGRLAVVFDAHLRTGATSRDVNQRIYESTRLVAMVRNTLAVLRLEHPSLDWDTATTYVAGDLNTHKSRTGDGALDRLAAAGWHDAFDQARVLVRQHHNSMNPKMLATPPLGIKWGDHIDKVLVQPGKTVVLKWANMQKMSGSKYTKLASDHLPIMVWLKTTP